MKILYKIVRRIFVLLLFIFLNSSIFAGINDLISLSHKHGFYNEPFTLNVKAENSNLKLYYTLDGTHPFYSNSAVIGNSEISISIDSGILSRRDIAPGVVLRVCPVQDGELLGAVITQTYLFPNKILDFSLNNVKPGSGWLSPGATYDINYGLDPEIYNDPKYTDQMVDAFLSIPTMSIVVDLKSLFDADSGIYVNSFERGKEWERHASLELLNPDESNGFQIDCGMRIRGGFSRSYENPKHAFRFFFRKLYGEGKLKFPLFGTEGVDEFDNIDLRTSQNYSWALQGDSRNTFIRDVFSRDLQRDMGQPYTRSRYYHLFINGTYWGLYQTQERSEASFAESYFGSDKSDYDVIKVDAENGYVVEATDGTLDKWKELWDAGKIGFENDESYFKVQGMNPDGSINTGYEKLLDVDNLIDYMIITFFTGDFDAPVSNFLNNQKPNNFYAIYNRNNPDGFKFFRHDAEHTLFNTSWGIDRTGPFTAGNNFEDSNPQWIHQRLSANRNYKLRFADRVQKYFFNNGVLTYQKNAARILNRKNEIETAIIAESARWGDSKTTRPFTKEDWNNEINFILNSYLPLRNNVVLSQLINKGLFTANSAPIFSIPGGVVERNTEISLSSNTDSIYYTVDGSDPYLPFQSEDDFNIQLIDQNSFKKVLIPKSFINNNWISELDYNDENWIETTGGIGYDLTGDYNKFISLNVQELMHESGNDPNTSCFVRIPFSLNEKEFKNANQLFLDIAYDDGFAAFLNGYKILEVNIPNTLTWNSASETFLESEGYEKFNLSQYLNLLKEGENLLSIHAVNTSIQSSDFLIAPLLSIANQSNIGIVSPSAKLFTEAIKISETTTLKARSYSNNILGVLAEANYLIDENLNNLKITELHYHPLNEIIDQDTISNKEYEFLELKNIGEVELNLTASSFVDGISYTFPNGSIIPPGEFIVLASNKSEFLRRYGFSPYDEYSGQLDNGGERIEFVNPVNKTVFSFTYDDKEPWPEKADGDGYSLVSKRRNPIENPDNVDYWVLSSVINGSPNQNDEVSNFSVTDNSIPEKFNLFQNYPNPFNSETTIKYSIAINEPYTDTTSKVIIKVFDILGREVKTLVNQDQKPGNYQIIFNASDLSSGIYLYRLNSGNFSAAKKLLLIK